MGLVVTLDAHTPTRVLVARGAATVLMGLAVASTFHRVFVPADFVLAAIVPALIGAGFGIAAALLARRSEMVGAALWAIGLASAVTAARAGLPDPISVVDGVVDYLTIGLPAEGLPGVRVVGALAVAPAVMALAWATVRASMRAVVVVAVVSLAVASWLTHPAGFHPLISLALVAAVGVAAALEARVDLAALPSLGPTRTEMRSRDAWWRPIPVAAAVVAASVVATFVIPVTSARSLRDATGPDVSTEEIENALSSASRLDRETSRVLATVTITGAAEPGRGRFASLDVYDGVSWTQAGSYRPTSARLLDDPLFALDDSTELLDAPRVRVSFTSVEPSEGDVPFPSVLTFGRPDRVEDPEGVMWAADAAVLTTASGRGDSSVAYETRAQSGAISDESVRVSPGVVGDHLLACPDQSVIAPIAQQIASTQTDPVGRLDELANWLKAERVYDPGAPGGQTLGSITRFLSQPFARGNMETFVTAHALLARCAGVPARVAVGVPSVGIGTTPVASSDVTAWVETPVVGAGWIAVDPLPTAEEQLQQARLVEEDDAPSSTTTTTTSPARAVEPVSIESGSGTNWRLIGCAFVGVLAIAAVGGWWLLAPWAIVRRRRRAAHPHDAVRGAWQTIVEAVTDRGVSLTDHHTPTAVSRIVMSAFPRAGRLVEHVAPIVDRATYAGEAVTADSADQAWATADEVRRRIGRSWGARLFPLTSPGIVAARWRDARRTSIGSRVWRGALAAELLAAATSHAAPEVGDIDGIVIHERIGEGATSAVYRATHVDSGRDIALKVFHQTPDPARFEWEMAIAQDFSGRPHLPVIVISGVSSRTGRAYLATTLFRKGTLEDRVRSSGPLTGHEAESMAADIASALQTMHERGVVHADVKPENIFASDDGWVLGDLGAAWLRGAKGASAWMTPSYAAPEVLRYGHPSPQSDLYSLGLTLVFAITGRTPVTGVRPQVEVLRPLIAHHDALDRCLAESHDRRPRSAAELLAMLDRGSGPITSAAALSSRPLVHTSSR
jgi:hypothetical protein